MDVCNTSHSIPINGWTLRLLGSASGQSQNEQFASCIIDDHVQAIVGPRGTSSWILAEFSICRADNRTPLAGVGVIAHIYAF